MSIKVKILVPVVVMLGYVFFSTYMVHEILRDQRSVAAVINIAGRQRMLTQKMTKELLFHLHTKDPTFLEKMRETMQIFDISLNALIDSGKVPTSLSLKRTKWLFVPAAKGKVREQLLKVRSLWQEFKGRVEALLSGKDVEANLEWIKENNTRLLAEMNRAVFMMQHDAEKSLSMIRKFQFVGLGVGLLATILVILALVSVGRRIDYGMRAVSEVTQDGVIKLDVDFETDGADEIARMLQVVAEVTSRIAERMREITYVAGKIISELPKGLNVDVNVTVVSQEYQLLMEDVANAIDELNVAIRDLANEASRVANSASEAMEITKEGMEKVRASARKSEGVEKAIGELDREAHELNEVTCRIADILKVINDISDQTSLLALNAAIEAARAGEHGRGFAVVADEVRKLAEQTQKATKDIEDMVQQISMSVGKVRERSDVAINFVREQVAAVEDAMKSFDEVHERIVQLNELIMKVSSTTEEQSAVVSQIATTADSLREKSNEVAANIEESSAAIKSIAESLHAMFDELVSVVFKEGVQDINSAMKAHIGYVLKVLEYCMGESVDVESLLSVSYEGCPFKKYLESDAARKLLGDAVCSEVDDLHRKVHEAASMCIEAKRSGDMRAVVEYTDVLADAAHRLLSKLAQALKEV